MIRLNACVARRRREARETGSPRIREYASDVISRDREERAELSPHTSHTRMPRAEDAARVIAQYDFDDEVHHYPYTRDPSLIGMHHDRQSARS